MTQRGGAGVDFLHVGKVDATGYFTGAISTPTAGSSTGVGAYRLKGAQTIPVALQEDEIVNRLGDNNVLLSFDFPPDSLPSGVISMAIRDNAFDAAARGINVYTQGGVSFVGGQPQDISKPDWFLLAQRRSKDLAAGAKKYEGVLMPRATVTPLFTEFNQRAADPYNYSFNLNPSDRYPWGASFREAAEGFLKDSIVTFDTDYLIHVMTYLGDNSQTVFNLDFTPVSSSTVYAYIDGVSDVVADVTAKAVTLTSTPGTNAIVNIFYEVTDGELA